MSQILEITGHIVFAVLALVALKMVVEEIVKRITEKPNWDGKLSPGVSEMTDEELQSYEENIKRPEK